MVPFARNDFTVIIVLVLIALCCRELLRDSRVKFVGYKHPHPLDNDILLRIQTAQGTAPTQALATAASRLEGEFRLMATQFASEVRRVQAEREQLG